MIFGKKDRLISNSTNIKYVFIFICIGLIFSSCTENQVIIYDCTIDNTTNYRIDKIEFSCAIASKTVSVPPNSVSEKFELIHEKSVWHFFGEPLLCITITEYSDSTETYQNSYGSVYSISDLSRNNEFLIEYEQNSLYPTDIFNVTIK